MNLYRLLTFQCLFPFEEEDIDKYIVQKHKESNISQPESIPKPSSEQVKAQTSSKLPSQPDQQKPIPDNLFENTHSVDDFLSNLGKFLEGK